MSTTSGNRAIFALAAALAFASFGCQQATTDDADDDESVASASQQLDPADEDDSDGQHGGVIHPGGDCQQGEKNGDPQPQPWRNGASNGSSKPGPNPVDPSSKTSSVVPSGGHKAR
jgi:hypothetical protein